MRKLGTSGQVQIGKFNPDSTSPENRMTPIIENFDGYGAAVLDSLINDASEWITIDEIGYLEGTSRFFINKLNELFERKRVMAVVRKQDIKHINEIISREDTLAIDLDKRSLSNQASFCVKIKKSLLLKTGCLLCKTHKIE